jgi:hypothetical protein
MSSVAEAWSHGEKLGSIEEDTGLVSMLDMDRHFSLEFRGPDAHTPLR